MKEKQSNTINFINLTSTNLFLFLVANERKLIVADL